MKQTRHDIADTGERINRAGIESAAIKRLVDGIEPPAAREGLAQSLAGNISPAVALTQLLKETGDAALARTAVDEITSRAATLSRSGDSLLRDRVDELTQLVVENEAGCLKVAELLRRGLRPGPLASQWDDEVAGWERLFDWAVREQEEASVAPHSLGSAELLERATREIIAQLQSWRLLGRHRAVLDLGSGIGRLAAELAPLVASVHGVDISTEMMTAAAARCAGLNNVQLLRTSGKNLREFGDGQFDLVLVVDTFPYIEHSGEELTGRLFSEIARVLRPGGDFVILGFSESDDEIADEGRVRELALANSLELVVPGTRPLPLWNALAFHLRKPPAPQESRGGGGFS